MQSNFAAPFINRFSASQPQAPVTTALPKNQSLLTAKNELVSIR